MSICRICKEDKPDDAFGVNRRNKSGRQTLCLQCNAEQAKAWRESNPEKARRYSREYNKSDAGRERLSLYRKRNPQKTRQRTREYYSNNRERILAEAKANKAQKAQQREYRQAKKDQIAERVAKWASENKDRRRASTARYRANNPEKVAEYYQRTKGVHQARAAMRRAKKLLATPSWANTFFIKEIYDIAALRSDMTGIKHHVDHIMPLQGDAVCGLHVESNLRVITAFENISKGNKLLEVCNG